MAPKLHTTLPCTSLVGDHMSPGAIAPEHVWSARLDLAASMFHVEHRPPRGTERKVGNTAPPKSEASIPMEFMMTPHSLAYLNSLLANIGRSTLVGQSRVNRAASESDRYWVAFSLTSWPQHWACTKPFAETAL